MLTIRFTLCLLLLIVVAWCATSRGAVAKPKYGGLKGWCKSLGGKRCRCFAGYDDGGQDTYDTYNTDEQCRVRFDKRGKPVPDVDPRAPLPPGILN